MGAASNFKPLQVLGLIVAVRLASVFLVQTWYVPDEYWQSLEVGHNLAFGYGHLSWEWAAGIRSYVHPAIIAGLYKLLELMTIDCAELLVILPRVLQALLSSAADYSFYKWSGCRKWALFLCLTQWFWFYTASRTLINSAETAIITMALARFPFEAGKPKDAGWLCLAAMSCVIRPTAAIIWTPLCIYHFITTTEDKKRLIAFTYIPIELSIFGLATLIDSYFHGQLIFTSWEFLKLNVLEGVGSFYGSHPWYWYLAIGLPVVLGVTILPFLFAAFEAIKNRAVYKTQCLLLSIVALVLAVYSCLPHKEFRFILPLVPIVMFITQDFLARWSRKAKALSVYVMFLTILIGNAVPIGYFSMVHQRGVLDVMPVLRDIAVKHPTNTSLLFLMPCHSTPLYSHLHAKVPVRFLTCEPNLTNKPNYKDEAEIFYENPARWFQTEYINQQVGETGKKSKLPSHIIAFDKLVPEISNVMAYYSTIETLFHSGYPEGRVGNSVVILERVPRNNAQKPAPPSNRPNV